MNIQDITTAIDTAISNTPSLNSLNPDFVLGIPKTFPCVTLDGLICIDDKQGKWTANVNLWVNQQPSLSFVQLAQSFYSILSQCEAIQTDGILFRPDPQENLERALMPVTFWLK